MTDSSSEDSKRRRGLDHTSVPHGLLAEDYEEEDQFHISLSKCMEVAMQLPMSRTHPNPHFGGDDIEDHLACVIPRLDHKLKGPFPNGREGQAERLFVLRLLAAMYQVQYRRNDRPEDSNQASALIEEAKSIESGMVESEQVQKSELESSILACAEATRQMRRSSTHPDLNIGGGDIEVHLARVISSLHQLLQDHHSCSCDHNCETAQLSCLADAYEVRYRRNNRLEDLERFQQTFILLDEAQARSAEEDPMLKVSVMKFLDAVQHMQNRDPHIGGHDFEVHLARVISSTSRRLKAASSNDDEERVNLLHVLAAAYQLRYMRNDRSEDHEQVLAFNKEVEEIEREQILYSAKRLLEAKQQIRKDRVHHNAHVGGDDIEVHLHRLIPYIHRLLESSSSDDSEVEKYLRIDRLHRLADVYTVLYVRNYRQEDLDRVLELLEKIKGLLVEGDKLEYIDVFNSLASLQEQKYQETLSQGDLELGFKWAKDAISIAEANDIDSCEPTTILSNILYHSFIQSGNIEHLDQSLELLLGSVEDHPSCNGPEAKMLLSGRFFERFKKINNSNDLQQAKIYMEKAMSETKEDDPAYGPLLINLSTVYTALYVAAHDEVYLDTAIQCCHGYLTTELFVKDQVIAHMDLVKLLLMKHGKSKESAELSRAVDWLEHTVQSLSPTDPSSSFVLCILGDVYSSRHEVQNFIQTGESRDTIPSSAFKDLDKAIEYYKRAIESMPVGHLRRSILLQHAGAALGLRGSATTDEGISLLTEVMDDRTVLCYLRIISAQTAALLHAFRRDWSKAASCTLKALELLPEMSPRSLLRDDQQDVLSGLSGNLAADSASFALEAQLSPYEALRRLEQGRGIIMGFAIDLRSDIKALKTSHHDLYNEFNNLRNTIGEISLGLEDPGGIHFSLGPESMDLVTRKRVDHRKLQDSCEKLQMTISRIRDQQGFGGFLLPPTEEQMKSFAKDGAIVVINSTKWRSDALIVTKYRISQIPLPDLEYDIILKNVNDMNDIFETSNPLTRNSSDNNRLSVLLLWLWDAAVKPVCNALGLLVKEEPKKMPKKMPKKKSKKIPNENSKEISEEKSGEKPEEKPKRIWWIGVGPLSRAPFHAAGHHSPNSKSNTISVVKSSYISTIKALSYSRQDAAPSNGKANLRIDLVGMPDTPGHRPLPSVDEEISQIKEIALISSDSVATETLIKPTTQEVLKHLSQNCGEGGMRIVHFACHGISDPKNPLESHVLLLKDTNADPPQVDRLTVREVSSMTLGNAYLAYLGACHSANNSVMALADEGLHIVSSFQLAGFRNVIGNMWKAEDEECTTFSKAFYKHLLKSDRKGRNEDDVVDAYHDALQELRNESCEDFIGWIPFVHSGA